MAADPRVYPMAFNSISTNSYDRVCFICFRCISIKTECLEKRFVSTQTDVPGSKTVSTQTDIRDTVDSVASMSQPVINSDKHTREPYMLDLGPFSSMRVMVIPTTEDEQSPEQGTEDEQSQEQGTEDEQSPEQGTEDEQGFERFTGAEDDGKSYPWPSHSLPCDDKTVQISPIKGGNRQHVEPRLADLTSAHGSSFIAPISFNTISASSSGGTCDTAPSSDMEKLGVIDVPARSPLPDMGPITESSACQTSIPEERCAPTSQADFDLFPDVTAGFQSSIVSGSAHVAPESPCLADHMYSRSTPDTWANVLGIIDKIAAGYIPLSYGNQDVSQESVSQNCGKIVSQDTNLEADPGCGDLDKHSIEVLAPRKKKTHFQCIICHVKFRSKQYLGRHIKLHRDPDPYLCELCPSRFVKHRHLMDHWETKHSGKTPMKVLEWVRKSGEKSKKLSKQPSQFPGTGQWNCSKCGTSFKSRGTSDKHESLHSDSDPYACGVCGTGFLQLRHLEIHSENHAPEDRNACFVLLGSAPKGKRITAEKAARPGQHECSICLKPYQSEETLRRHIKWFHLDRKMHVCEHCGKRFTVMARLREHVLRHTDVKPYECATCGAKRHTLKSLEDHMFNHLGKRPYPCSTCGKTFKTTSAISRHKLSHQPPLMCDTCGKTFARKCYLEDHALTHTKLKPHICAECGRGFSWKDNLGAHMKLFHKTQGK